MLNPEHFAVTLARAVDLLRTHPHATADHKTALRALVALTKLGAPVVTLADGELAVNGTGIPPTLPAIAALTSALRRLGVTEIRIAQNASPSDLLQLVRALAEVPETGVTADNVEQRLSTWTTTISVLSVKPETLLPGEEPMRVTEAFEAVEDELGPSARVPVGPAPESGTPLDRLRAQPFGRDTADRLNAVSDGVRQALERMNGAQALELLEAMLDFEADAPEGPARRSYGMAIRWLLTADVIAQIAALVPDATMGETAARVVRRAGAEGTEVLLRNLADGDTMDERLAYFAALKEIREGTELVVGMLGHHQWYVIRNVADLSGELRLAEAAPALGKAVQHYDARVQRSAARALVRIGSPPAFEALRRALTAGNDEVKLTVAQAAEDRSAAPLAASLVQAAETETDPKRQREYYRALGRIGSPEAVKALRGAAEPGGRLFGRKPTEPRLAAIEGLALVKGPTAAAALQALLKDADAQVREAAGKALAEVSKR